MGALERLVEADAVARLHARDTSLFSDDIDVRIAVGQRLGWTDLAEKAPERFTLLSNLAAAIAAEGITDVLLLGMGGSSLAPLVLARMLGPVPGSPALHVLDTTSPVAVTDLLGELDPVRTFVVVASKSGTTVEPLSLYAIVRAWLERTLTRPEAGRRCMVITDPGTPLEKLRQRDLMRVAITAPANVGGRYSALTVFGLAPVALVGIGLQPLVERARIMEAACAGDVGVSPAALLASWIADALAAGRDKLTLVTSAAFEPFGLWVEQLVAESLGKHGLGAIPVLETGLPEPTAYGSDRAIVVIREAHDTALEAWARAAGELHPVTEIRVGGPMDVAAEFVRWEWATALVGFLLGVNPFDEPNVAQAKQATNAILAGTTVVPHAAADLSGTWVTYAGGLGQPELPAGTRTQAVASLLDTVGQGGYLAVLAYVPESGGGMGELAAAARAVASVRRCAVTLELGPRYLHSTGQLHKGGPATGAFLLVTARDRLDLEIPGQRFTLAALHRAQAEGDLVTLASLGRPVLRLDLPDSSPETIAALAEDLERAAHTGSATA